MAARGGDTPYFGTPQISESKLAEKGKHLKSSLRSIIIINKNSKDVFYMLYLKN